MSRGVLLTNDQRTLGYPIGSHNYFTHVSHSVKTIARY